MTIRADDLTIERGAELLLYFRLTDPTTGDPVDVTGWGARWTVRTPNANGELVTGYDLSTGDSPPGIEIADGPDGLFLVRLDAETTRVGPDDSCRGWQTFKGWESDPLAAKRYAEGVVRWSEESTRDDESGA